MEETAMPIRPFHHRCNRKFPIYFNHLEAAGDWTD
jgi:hypothetical protein